MLIGQHLNFHCRGGTTIFRCKDRGRCCHFGIHQKYDGWFQKSEVLTQTVSSVLDIFHNMINQDPFLVLTLTFVVVDVYRYAYQIVLQIREMLQALPSHVDIQVPNGRHFTVCGDVHGQVKPSRHRQMYFSSLFRLRFWKFPLHCSSMIYCIFLS